MLHIRAYTLCHFGGASWNPVGSLLGASRGPLGLLLGLSRSPPKSRTCPRSAEAGPKRTLRWAQDACTWVPLWSTQETCQIHAHWDPFGALLEPSWGHLGALLRIPQCLIGLSRSGPYKGSKRAPRGRREATTKQSKSLEIEALWRAFLLCICCAVLWSRRKDLWKPSWNSLEPSHAVLQRPKRGCRQDGEEEE